MKYQVLLVSALAICFGYPANAETEIATDAQRFSYAVGFQVGQQLQQRLTQEGMELDAVAFVEAIQDVLNGNDPKLALEEMQAAYQAGITERQQAREQIAGENLEAGQAFLEENKAKEGIVETESGMQYRVMQEGTGETPAVTDTVIVHYEGKLINGTKFDSSYARGTPATFPVNGIIPGWQEALQLMKVGAIWEVFIPAELAYGTQGAAAGGIGPNETLVFKVELIEVK
ncbi:MAG: FKBP-type peptidyl-prolyl cis-trans isomerase [Gammaproteobacteria bacterium]|nr:FKBP-type peptidyl-prolyl cis-trans isomerase [Gammaproteobacteria bacterium]